MEFDLSADQKALREAAGALLDGVAPMKRVRAVVGSALDVQPQATFDRSLWRAMAEQGWLAIEQDEPSGGLGLGAVEVAVLCEEAGRHLAPVPFAETILCLGALCDAAEMPADSGASLDDVQTRSDVTGQWRQCAVARLTDGRGSGCVAWTPAPGSTDAERRGDTWELTGAAELVLWGPTAEVMVVLASDGVYAVDLAHTGPAPAAQPAMDRTRSVGWAVMQRTPAEKIGGPDAVTRVVDRAATLAAAQLLGVAGRVLDMSVEYAGHRQQFGRAIGSFQAVKHRLADALVDVEAMRSSVYYAAWCLAVGDGNASLASSMAKAWCSEAAMRVVASGLQVHGGIGFTWEHDLHLFLKRAQLDATVFGNATWHRERIAGLLEDRSEDPTMLF